MNIFFENIRIINSVQNLDDKFNLWVKDGKIEFVGKDSINLDSDTEVIKADNLVCSPGLFDMHVHFRDPGFTQKEDVKSGSEAAANGGFTGVLMMPNTSPCIDDVTVVHYLQNMAKDNLVDVEISGAITKGRKGELLTPMLQLKELGVKLFTDDGTCINNPDMLRRAFEYAATGDLLISQHCEEHKLTAGAAMNESKLSYNLGLKGYPNMAEDMIVSRDIMMAEFLGNRRYHIQHLSTEGSVELIRQAKAKGNRVTGEVTPHHFSLTEEVMNTYGTNYKMNPPLRQHSDVNAIIEGLKDGTIDCIASDHAPHSLNEKDVPLETAPNGITGLETSLAVTLTNLYHTDRLDLSRIIDLMSVNPRKILDMPEIKIEKGEQANLTIFNPDEEWTYKKENSLSKSTNSPFVDFNLRGKPVCAINNNKMFKSVL